MQKYNLSSSVSSINPSVQFSYKGLPVLFFVTLHTLGYIVELTGSRMLPYHVNISEPEFLSCIELSEAQS